MCSLVYSHQHKFLLPLKRNHVKSKSGSDEQQQQLTTSVHLKKEKKLLHVDVSEVHSSVMIRIRTDVNLARGGMDEETYARDSICKFSAPVLFYYRLYFPCMLINVYVFIYVWLVCISSFFFYFILIHSKII